MKTRIIAILLAITASLLLASCTVTKVKEEVTDEKKENVTIPNENYEKNGDELGDLSSLLPDGPIELPIIPVSPSDTEVIPEDEVISPPEIERPNSDSLITPDENELPVIPMN